MGYWKDLYGNQSNEFIDGVIAGVTAMARAKNGIYVVGVLDTPLDKKIKEIKEEMGYDEEKK